MRHYHHQWFAVVAIQGIESALCQNEELCPNRDSAGLCNWLRIMYCTGVYDSGLTCVPLITAFSRIEKKLAAKPGAK
jgi:hypothetical protein